jgi:hypothetical protein
MANTGRIPLWLVGLVGGLAVITMLALFILWFIFRFRFIIIIKF